MDNFDPIEFLGLEIENKRREEISQKVLIDMTWFLLLRVIGGLPEDEIQKVIDNKDKFKGPQDAFDYIRQVCPDFESRKDDWLQEYKSNFSLKKLLEEESG